MSGFISELKRRNVFRVGAAYAVVAWLLVQMGEAVFPAFGVPEWIFRTMVMLLLFGFPIILVFAWAFELTPDGIKRDNEVSPERSITPITGRKLDRTIIVLLVLALAYFIFESRIRPAQDTQASAVTVVTPTDQGIAHSDEGKKSAAHRSIAVLPFASRSTREDDLFFSDGIHDDLLTQLAKIGSLKVISRTSTMKYRDTDKTIPEIARELGVEVILEGGVQRAGDNVRINMQLIEATTDQHLWAETYDRQLTVQNMFQIQSEITRSVVAALRTTLTETESATLEQIPTRNMDAYRDYRRGIALLRTSADKDEIVRAQISFSAALTRDPDFTLARIGLARATLQRYWTFERSPAILASAGKILDELDGVAADNPEYLKARAHYYYWGFRDYPSAVDYLDKALTLAPNDSELYTVRGYITRRSGNTQAALADLSHALELDPLNPSLRFEKGFTLLYLRRFDEARASCLEALDQDPNQLIAVQCLFEVEWSDDADIAAMRRWSDTPGAAQAIPNNLQERWQARFFAGDIAAIRAMADGVQRIPGLETLYAYPEALQQGLGEWYFGDRELAKAQLAKAERLLADAMAATPADHRLPTARAMAMVLIGDPEQAIELARRSTTMLPYTLDAVDGPVYQWDLGLVLAMAGRYKDSAEIFRAVVTQPGIGTVNMLKIDPRAAEAIKHPAFASLLKSAD